MLFYVASFLFAASVSAVTNGRTDIIYPSVETARSGEKIIKFKAFDQFVHLRLEPASDVIAEDFVMLNGANEEMHSVDIKNLKRKLYKDRNTETALYVDEEGPTIINGVINSKLKIEPDQSINLNKDGRVAHRVIEVLRSENDHANDEIIRPLLKNNFNLRLQLSEDECIIIELVFILDSHFTGSFNNDSDLMLYIFNTANIVQRMYDSLELGIKIILNGVITITEENEANEAPYIQENIIPNHPDLLDYSSLMYRMAKYYCNRQISLIYRADAVMFITSRRSGKLFDGKLYQNLVLGISMFGQICNRCYKFGVARETSKTYMGADFIAHELAHLLGAVHDGDDPVNWIPNSPGATDCSPKDKHIMGNSKAAITSTFSRCSRDNIENFLTLERASCIIDKCEVDCNRCAHCSTQDGINIF